MVTDVDTIMRQAGWDSMGKHVVEGFAKGITDNQHLSEVQDAYKNTVNKNSVITVVNGFPKLIAGMNEVSFSGGITSMEVMPK